MAANYLAFAFLRSWISLMLPPLSHSSVFALLSASHPHALKSGFPGIFGSTEEPCVTVLNKFNSDVPNFM